MIILKQTWAAEASGGKWSSTTSPPLIDYTEGFRVTAAHWQQHQKLFLPHPVPDSSIITWLNLKGKLCFDLLRKKILLWGSGTRLTPFRRRCMGLSWQQRDFLSMPIRQLQHSICGHLKRTAPPQVIPEKSPPTLNKYFDTWTVPLSRLWCYSVKNTLLNKFSLPLQAVHQSGAMALASLYCLLQLCQTSR